MKMTVKKKVHISKWSQAIEQAKKAGVTTHLHQTGGTTKRWVVITETGKKLIMG
jgi:hypothetical protein